MRKVTDAVHRDLKRLEFDHKPRGAFGIVPIHVAPPRDRM
jgi:hypothetical protein